MRSLIGEGFVAPDLSPRYTLDSFQLTVDPPSRDFVVFYEPKSTRDPRVLLQLFAHRANLAVGHVSEITTPAGNLISVGTGEAGYSGAWSLGGWYYIAVVLDTTERRDDIVAVIADAIFATPQPSSH